MRQCLVKRSKLKGFLEIPSSKSQTLRAILFATMADGKSIIYRYLNANDTFAMIDACRLLGASIDVFQDRLEIIGINGHVEMAQDVIDAKNSGIVLRFISALGALATHPIVITGDHSIRKLRPMKDLIDGLTELGVSVMTMRGDDRAPIILKGPLTGGKTTITGSDSQPVSALLIAAAFANQESEINVSHPGELPWVNMTLNWFNRPMKIEGLSSMY